MRQIEFSQDLCDQVLAIARQAGCAIMRIYADMRNQTQAAKDVLVAHKADDSPLTQADLLAHQTILLGLAALTPAIPVVSEEDQATTPRRLMSGDFWLIDPLDGTKEFLAQNDEFTVNIALIRMGRPIFGVVLAPALDQAYWGGVGLGAFRQTAGTIAVIHVAGQVAVDQPVRVVASKSHLNQATLDFINRLGEYTLVQAGSSLKFCRIAEGVADIYPRLGPTCEWDTAAGQAVVEGAGGYVATVDGMALRYGKINILNPYFVASSTVRIKH